MASLLGFFICCGFLNFPRSSNASNEEDNFELERQTMVRTQIEARGVVDSRVLAAMAKVKRHLFVPQHMRLHAYEDSALPIEKNQTISQPYIVGLMTELAHIKPGDKVLEIGTGSGYQAAILAEIAKEVYSIEIIRDLADQARERLIKLGYKNIEVKHGDGYLGWPQETPYDAILVTAAAPEIPQELVKQLKTGGRMVLPLGDFSQELYVLTKNADGSATKERIIPVRFVPMVKKTEDRNQKTDNGFF
ncbi:MAG: protein-L-isoaspartate(D-aspartate) O-methyltransferase [Candidatus Omnitrophica bacterium]|nr:protein-L-isoaspartate(D-aspartate) O-methyltransferase [Candidatus Omnitrophota bacterium]